LVVIIVILGGIIIEVNPDAFANWADLGDNVIVVLKITVCKLSVFINANGHISVTIDGIVYELPVFPAGYVYNFVPSFENKHPSTDVKYVLAGSVVILTKLIIFENNNPFSKYLLSTSDAFDKFGLFVYNGIS
jgi:hypothetical protein